MGVPAADAAGGWQGGGMEPEVLRGLLFEAIRRRPDTQYNQVQVDVRQLAADRGREALDQRDERRLLELTWSLIVQGVIIPGSNVDNHWPWMRVTEYGRECLAAGEILPHDPDGYLRQLKVRIPIVDDVILLYVEESLECFLASRHIASTVMLGVASEKAFYLLLDPLISYLGQPTGGALRKATQGKPISKQFEEFEKRLNGVRANLPPDLQEGLDVQLTGIFTFVRNYRNDAGHPTGRRITREEAFANLILFVPYLQRVYGLIQFFARAQPAAAGPAL